MAAGTRAAAAADLSSGCSASGADLELITKQIEVEAIKKIVMDRQEEKKKSIENMAKSYIDAGWGREITKEEALEFLKKNEEEGLIFRPGNSQKIDFLLLVLSIDLFTTRNFLVWKSLTQNLFLSTLLIIFFYHTTKQPSKTNSTRSVLVLL